MFSDLIVNAAILVAFVCIGNQIFRDTDLDTTSPLFLRFLAGGICGILGILLMIYSVEVSAETIIDFRNIAIIIAGTLGGTVSILVSSLLIGVFRISYYGINTSSIAGLIVSILIGMGLSIIFRSKIPMRRKWVYSLVYCLSISTVALSSLLNPDVLSYTLFCYIIGTSFVAFIVYKYMEYLQGVTQLFRKLKEESAKDYLTGLNNVRQFDRVFNGITEKAVNNNEVFSLLFIDIDFFKKVNDTYGHHEGDRVLKELSKILTHTCRACDIVSRNGGEEFSVILEDCPVTHANEIAERIRRAVGQHEFRLSTGGKIRVTVSIGIVSYPETIEDISKIIEGADSALYKAKREGRNRVVVQ